MIVRNSFIMERSNLEEFGLFDNFREFGLDNEASPPQNIGRIYANGQSSTKMILNNSSDLRRTGF